MGAVGQRAARSTGISYQELIARDVVAPPRTLTWRTASIAADVRTGQPLHDASVLRSRNAAVVAEGVADGVPRRTDPGRWRFHDVRNRQPFDHRRAHAAGHSGTP